MLISNQVKELYDKYSDELLQLQTIQKSRYKNLNAHFDDIECELLYMFVREHRPNHMIEFSPQYGWSTSWIIEALNKNNKGKCVSYDLHDTSVTQLNNINLDISRWQFIGGDVQKQYKNFDFESIDFIFIDSDHSIKFTQNYIDNVLIVADRVYKTNNKKVPVFIHDIYGRNASSKQEGVLIKDFIKSKKLDYFTPSILSNDRPELNSIRNKYGLSKNIIHSSSNVNPVVIFMLGKEN